MSRHWHLSIDKTHPAIKALHLRSTEPEVTAAMHAAGASSYKYAQDSEFAVWVLQDVTTYAQAKALADLLDADRFAMEGTNLYGCQKAGNLRSSLRSWRYSAYSRANMTTGESIAHARRTCCGCHKLGSFAIDDRQRSRAKEIREAKKGQWRKKNL